MPNAKDISEKHLFDWPDVFADIWNFIAFDGKSVIQPIDLLGTKARTQFKVDGKLHEQERNVAKIWMAGEVRFALLGLENQTVVDENMLLRVISYDGANYKEQVNAHNLYLQRKNTYRFSRLKEFVL